MDFGINTVNGHLEMTWDKPDDISTNILLIVNTEKGSMFNNKNFGVKKSDITNVNDETINKLQNRYEIALQLLTALGKAKSVEVIVQRNKNNVYRIDTHIKVFQANGIPVIVNDFVTVGGPSGEYIP